MGIRSQLEHLDSRDATDEDVREYLEAHSSYITEAGGQATPVDVYWCEGDLGRYWMARDLWVRDAPPRVALPDLPTMLRGIAGPVGMPQTTFTGDLTRLWEGYAAWMQSEGRDPLDPTETRRQASARRARESMARTRARRSGTDPEQVARLEEAKRLYDAYITACRARREAVAVLDEDVRCAHAAYELARDAAKT